MARIPKRHVDGIVLLDKPSGMTSNAALQTVRRLLNAAKAGHTGSLDPLATGLLPLCFGEATKVSGFLLDADKRYRVTVKLGERTDTGDSDGEVIESRPVAVDRAQVEEALAAFRGPIEQLPPMYSAVRHQGQRLYELARQGVEVERTPRTVTIYELTLVEFRSPELVLDVHCSKGTYVRSLAESLGERLGCGAHVTALRRTGLGPFDAERMVTLEQLRALAERGQEELDKVLLPMDIALKDWPELRLHGDAAYYLCQGQPVFVPQAPSDGLVRLYGGGRFLGIGIIQSDGRVAPKRLLARPAGS
jgi:tRNA pseudouridine 55 synthase